LQIDGLIAANGFPRFGAAAGAGGSIWLTVAGLRGSGLIRANGGDTDGGGGGGGGRVAIYYSDRAAFTGTAQALGGFRGRTFDESGGAGTVYWKASARPFGELIIDNGDRTNRFASTPLNLPADVHFESWLIRVAKVTTDAGVRVVNGDPGYFTGLISNNFLQVGGLLVSNIWVYGDVMDLHIGSQWSEVGGQEVMQALVTVYCRPQKTYLLQASTNLLDWIPVATNTPTGSRFDYLDTA
jgi:hypothetical protein